MAPKEEMNEDVLLLLHIIHKDNPTLSGGNWPVISAKMGQPADRIRDNPSLAMSNWKELCEGANMSVDYTKKRFAAMRKEFMEMGSDTAPETSAPRKRGRPAKNPKNDADDETKPKPKRAKTASAKKAAGKPGSDETGDEVGDSGSDAVAAPAAAAAKKPKKTKVKKEDASTTDEAPAANEDEA